MGERCSFREACDGIAFFDEAKIAANLTDKTIEELGWEHGAKVIMSAAFDTMNQIGQDAMEDLYAEVPSDLEKCEDCSLHRNDMIRLLIQETPSDPESL